MCMFVSRFDRLYGNNGNVFVKRDLVQHVTVSPGIPGIDSRYYMQRNVFH